MTRTRAAWVIAIGADLLQIALLPLFAEGALSPVDAGIDVAVGVALSSLVGFHWSFLPSFVTEAVPLLDLAPTWTGALWLASRSWHRRAPVTAGPPALPAAI